MLQLPVREVSEITGVGSPCGRVKLTPFAQPLRGELLDRLQHYQPRLCLPRVILADQAFVQQRCKAIHDVGTGLGHLVNVGRHHLDGFKLRAGKHRSRSSSRCSPGSKSW